jgi:hypothetical protein
MVDQKDSLAREVDEELRRERLLKLWEQYGTYIIAAAVVVLAGIGVYKYVENRRAQAAETAGAHLALAGRETAENKQADAHRTLEEIAAAAPKGYATLARLRLAAGLREAGNTKEAVSAYEAVAKEGGIDPLLAGYARLQAAMLRLDSADWTEMENRLTGLAADDNAWRHSARELLALAAQKAGKIADAREEYRRLLSDPGTPPGIAGRARVMMSMLTEAELAKAETTAPAPSAREPEAALPTGEGKVNPEAKAKAE